MIQLATTTLSEAYITMFFGIARIVISFVVLIILPWSIMMAFRHK